MSVVVVLLVQGPFETELVVHERLRDADIELIPVLPLFFVGTIIQVVVEVEDAGIRQLIVAVNTELGERQTRLASEGCVVVDTTRAVEGPLTDVLVDGAIGANAAVFRNFPNPSIVVRRVVTIEEQIRTTKLLTEVTDPRLEGGISGASEGTTVDRRADLTMVGTAGIVILQLVRIERLTIEIVIGNGLSIPGALVGAITEPRGDQVDRRQGARTVGVNRTEFTGSLDDRASGSLFEEARLVTHGTVDTLRIGEGRFLLELLTVGHRGDSDGQLVIDQNAVKISRAANRTEAAHLESDFVGVVEHRLLRADIDDTSGTALTEKNRVGATLEIHPVDIVAVPRDVGQEVVTGVIRCGQTTNTGVLIGIGKTAGFIEQRAVAGAGEVSLNVTDLSAHGILQQGFIIHRVDILEELLGHDGNGVTDVAEFSVQTITRQAETATKANLGRVFFCMVCMVWVGHFQRGITSPLVEILMATTANSGWANLGNLIVRGKRN